MRISDWSSDVCSSDLLALSRQRLEASLKAYAAGDRGAASDLALSAYLDGFEPVEPVLAARDPDLMAKIELAMGDLRSAIGKGRPIAEVEAANAEVARLFVEAERSEEHTSELQSLMRTSSAVFCL